MIKRIATVTLTLTLALLASASASASVIVATASINSSVCGPNLADYMGRHSGRIDMLTSDDLNKTFILTGAMEKDNFFLDDTVSTCNRNGVAGNTNSHSCTTSHTGRCTTTTVRARSNAKIQEFFPVDRDEALTNWHDRDNCDFKP